MAIFKPSNCTPFLESWDLTEGHNISCIVNTNNMTIDGYKVRIFDSNNEIIFEGADFTYIGDKRLYNGDEFNKPLIIIKDKLENVSSPDSNVIYSTVEFQNNVLEANKEDKVWKYWKYDDKQWVSINNFGNGFENQPYKWQVIFAQGVTEKGTPSDSKYYDMTISSGVVAGSCPNRIQGKLSEEIFKDYFIQLYDKEKKKAVSDRVLIDSYDHTYGYIYPQKGAFTDEDIKKAKYFQIFKNTNNKEYIKTNRVVNYITNKAMSDISARPLIIKGVSTEEYSPSSFAPAQGSYNYYYTQIWKESGNNNAYPKPEGDISIPISAFCDNGAGTFIPGQTLLLVKDEGDQNQDGVMMSKDNGVFLFNSIEWVEGEEKDGKGYITATWQRPAMADTWAEFLGQSFFVESDSENWDSTATASGTINSTPIGFKKEEPIKIYPNNKLDEDKTWGEVLKTEQVGKEAKVYIRPFLGLESGMRFEYLNGQKYEAIDNVKINTQEWYVEFSRENDITTFPFIPDQTKYKITSFFKTSDENPFYAYKSPTLSIKIDDSTSTAPIVVKKRKIYPEGKYLQDNNKMWKSFQWTLLDYNYNSTQQTDVLYGGEMRGEFVGLENGHEYLLTLTVEDELGNIITAERELSVAVETGEDNVFDFDPARNVKVNCDLHSVDTTFSTAGVIIPTNNDVVVKDGRGLMLGEGAEQSYTQIQRKENGDVGAILEPNTNNITLNSQHTISGERFDGELIRLQFGEDKDSPYLAITTNPETITDPEGSGKIIANPDRYKLSCVNRLTEGRKRERSVNLFGGKEDGGWSPIDGNYWGKSDGVCFNLVDRARVESSALNSNCDYLSVDLITAEADGEEKKYSTEGLSNLRYNSSVEGFGSPLVKTNVGDEITTPNIWSDKKMKCVKQSDNSFINVFVEEDNVWDDDMIWNDYISSYEQVDANEKENHSGRQRLKDESFNFNIAYPNYTEKEGVEFAEVTINGFMDLIYKGEIGDENDKYETYFDVYRPLKEGETVALKTPDKNITAEVKKHVGTDGTSFCYIGNISLTSIGGESDTKETFFFVVTQENGKYVGLYKQTAPFNKIEIEIKCISWDKRSIS